MHMSFSCKFTDQKGKQLVKNMVILLLLPEVANRDRTNSYSDNAQQVPTQEFLQWSLQDAGFSRLGLVTKTCDKM
jgi:hypothetical protein